MGISDTPDKKVLRVGALSRLGTLDPREANDTISTMILNEIFESPYIAPNGPEAPELRLFTTVLRAESAGSKPVYSAQIQSAIRFSDGTPLTSEIFARSLMSSQDFKEHASAEARGDRIFFTLTRPNPRFDLVLTTNFSSIVLDKAGSLIGTGPFMFPHQASLGQLQRLDTFTLVRNPHYGKPVEIDEIRFKIYPASSGGGTEMLLEAAKRGEIDFTYSLTSVDAAALQGYPFVPSIGTGNATGVLHFNTTKPALNTALVRRALAYAIDRRKIAEATYEKNPLAYTAATLLPTLMGRDRVVFSYDPAKAKALAIEAGASMPKRLSLVILWSPRPYIPNPKRAGELIRDQLAAIGVTVDLVVPKDRSDYFDHVRRGSYDLLLGGWIADTADPADFLESLLSSRSVPSATNRTATTNNQSRWSHPPMDEGLTRFRAEPNETNRAEVMRILVEEAPLVPLIYGQAVAVYGRQVRGFRASALGHVSLAALQMR